MSKEIARPCLKGQVEFGATPRIRSKGRGQGFGREGRGKEGMRPVLNKLRLKCP